MKIVHIWQEHRVLFFDTRGYNAMWGRAYELITLVNLNFQLNQCYTVIYTVRCCGSWIHRRFGRFTGNLYGAGSGPIWLDDVDCRGEETDIAYCSHEGWGRHSCEHRNDVSVRCQTGITNSLKYDVQQVTKVEYRSKLYHFCQNFSCKLELTLPLTFVIKQQSVQIWSRERMQNASSLFFV